VFVVGSEEEYEQTLSATTQITVLKKVCLMRLFVLIHENGRGYC
jgi:hypothetical protein